ncbi:uncharacterized protein V1518DRAFT_417288 [Limtongia smithiae]|uniref:uncharacterized protein n=1 Tax=Limtongia smithiae TaxID=1125753 RepID=UPI0034CD19DA
MASTYASGLGPLPTAPPVLASSVLDMFSLKGKVASVTGSSSGIGLAVAIAFAQAGADVALWYSGNDTAVGKAAEIASTYGVKCRAYKCSVTDRAEVEETINAIYSDFGGLDIQVANAGVAWTAGSLIDADVDGDAQWAKVVDVDLNGVYYTAKYTGRIFKQQGHGSLIITGSMSGHIVNIPQNQAPYNAAKAAVIHLARSLAIEWAGFARVNSISPGYITTEITAHLSSETKQDWWKLIPMGREGLTTELVGAYLYLASSASTYTTGTDIIIDGGYCAP